MPVPVARSITRCGFTIGARKSLRCNTRRQSSWTMSRRSFSGSSLGSRYARIVTISFESWIVRQEEASTYTHRGIYGSDGRSRGESRAPTMSATRCTTIYMPKNIYEHAVGVRSVMVSYNLLCFVIRRVVLVLCATPISNALWYPAMEGYHTEVSTSTLAGAWSVVVAFCS